MTVMHSHDRGAWHELFHANHKKIPVTKIFESAINQTSFLAGIQTGTVSLGKLKIRQKRNSRRVRYFKAINNPFGKN